MNPEQSKQLRAPFPTELISLLPKLSCYQCSQSRDKECDRHRKAKCATCGAWISPGHIHLSYVGHAETTDRFLDVDPDWTWEPMAFDNDGLPKLDHNGGLWMRLTICGVTRPCYGDSQGKTGPNAVKEAIGDGLRNGGMRFGVALDLWAKSDLAAVHADKETGEVVPSAPQPAPAPQQGDPAQHPANDQRVDARDARQRDVNTAKRRIKTLGDKLGWTLADLTAAFADQFEGGVMRDAGLLQLQAFGDYLDHQAKALNGASA